MLLRSPALGRACIALLPAILMASVACGETDGRAADSAGTTVSEPRDQPDSDSRAGAAVDALVAEDMPTDEQSLGRVLDALPHELLGRQRERSEGTVIYRSDGEPDVFLEVMEAEDVGVRDETNRELLEMTARTEGRTVTDRRLDPSAGVMYVRGTEESDTATLHFVMWATEGGPYLFAAGADTSDALDALVDAFAKAAASG